MYVSELNFLISTQYIMMMTTTTTVMNTSPWEGKSSGSNDIYYMNFNPKGNKCMKNADLFYYL